MYKRTELARIGTTDLKVTRLSFGGAPIGNLNKFVEEPDARGALQAAWDAGVRYFDTAPFYGYGLSEQRTGRLLAGKNRDEYVLSTKVGRLIRPGRRTGTEINDGGKSYYLSYPEMCCVLDYGYDGVMRSHEDSLKRLGVERIDILHIHDPDDHFEWASNGAYKALDQLRSQGTIKAVSAGMNQWEMLSDFIDIGKFDCFLLAGRYSLLEQTALDTFLPKCLEHNVSIVIGGVYNSGLLANPKPGKTYNYQAVEQDMLDRALAIKRVCESHGVPLMAAALQFVSAHPAIATICIGARSAGQFNKSVELWDHPIPDSLWSDLKNEGLVVPEAPVPGSEEAS
jgi:D-threo-aldose 1-dehydrogenase